MWSGDHTKPEQWRGCRVDASPPELICALPYGGLSAQDVALNRGTRQEMFSSFGWSKIQVCWSQAEGRLSLAPQLCPGSRAPFLRPHPGTAVMGYSSQGEAYGHHINVQACPQPSHRLSHFFMWPGSCELEKHNPVTNVWSSQLHVQLMYH